MKEIIFEKFKYLFAVIVFIIVLAALILGFIDLLTFLELSNDTAITISVLVSFTIIFFIIWKYEKLRSEIYIWKNRDKIENTFNKHMYEDDQKTS